MMKVLRIIIFMKISSYDVCIFLDIFYDKFTIYQSKSLSHSNWYLNVIQLFVRTNFLSIKILCTFNQVILSIIKSIFKYFIILDERRNITLYLHSYWIFVSYYLYLILLFSFRKIMQFFREWVELDSRNYALENES